MSHRVIHFEIHADNPDRAIAFYGALFGWTFSRWEGPMPYWLITTGPKEEPGIDGGLLPRQGPAPVDGQAVNPYICTVGTPNLDDSLRQVVALGGQVAVPKMPVPGVGWFAYGKDPEGNLFGLMQNDPSVQ